MSTEKGNDFMASQFLAPFEKPSGTLLDCLQICIVRITCF
jgi:hypothetical protein